MLARFARLVACVAIVGCTVTPATSPATPPAQATTPEPATKTPKRTKSTASAAVEPARVPSTTGERAAPEPAPEFGPTRPDILAADLDLREATLAAVRLRLGGCRGAAIDGLLARLLTYEEDPAVLETIHILPTHWVVVFASPRASIEDGWRWEGHAIARDTCELDGSLVQGGPGGRLVSAVRFAGAPSSGAREALREAAGLQPLRAGRHGDAGQLLLAGVRDPPRLLINAHVIAVGPLVRRQPRVEYLALGQPPRLVDGPTARALGVDVRDFGPPLAAEDPATPEGLALRVERVDGPTTTVELGPYQLAHRILPGAARGYAIALRRRSAGVHARDTWGAQRWVLETREVVHARTLRWIGVADGLIFGVFADLEATPSSGGVLVIRARDGAVFRLEFVERVRLAELFADPDATPDVSPPIRRLCRAIDPTAPASRRPCNEGLATELAAVGDAALRVRAADGGWIELPLELLGARL
ncbi:MAG: hypothetical protein R3B09_05775 [Nannocystaceae bacterium]